MTQLWFNLCGCPFCKAMKEKHDAKADEQATQDEDDTQPIPIIVPVFPPTDDDTPFYSSFDPRLRRVFARYRNGPSEARR